MFALAERANNGEKISATEISQAIDKKIAGVEQEEQKPQKTSPAQASKNNNPKQY